MNSLSVQRSKNTLSCFCGRLAPDKLAGKKTLYVLCGYQRKLSDSDFCKFVSYVLVMDGVVLLIIMTYGVKKHFYHTFYNISVEIYFCEVRPRRVIFAMVNLSLPVSSNNFMQIRRFYFSTPSFQET